MIRWTDELVINESKKFKTRAEFARKSNSAYKESQKYHSRSEFKKNNRSAFDYIYKHNMLDEIAHLNGWK